MSGREPTYAEFEPAPLAPRRRRVDPVSIGALVVAIGILAAIVKPWDARDGDPGIATAPSSSAGIGSPSTSAPSGDPAGSAGAATAPPVSSPPIGWGRAAEAIVPHDRWGVRAIVLDPEPDATGSPHPGPVLVERWEPAEAAADALARVQLGTADQGVLALGVTFPPDELPLDIRVWRDTDAGWVWLDTPRIGSSPAFGGQLLGPPRVDGIGLPTWPTGPYRIEVLSGDGIRRIDLDLPDRFEDVPDPTAAPLRPDPPLVSPFAPDFRTVEAPGAFVVADGDATAVDAPEGPPMDPASLWIDGALGTHAPRANGIGGIFGASASGATGTLRRVAPDDVEAPAVRVVGLRFVGDERFPYVIFRAPGGSAFPPGVYRVDARWTESGEVRTASYHLELKPGEGATDALPLGAARRFAEVAGTEAIVGEADPPSGLQDLACADGDEAILADPPAIIGFGHPIDDPPTEVMAELLLDGTRRLDQPLLVARSAIPGLTLIAPANAAAFAPGAYRLTIGEGRAARVSTICAGVTILE